MHALVVFMLTDKSDTGKFVDMLLLLLLVSVSLVWIVKVVNSILCSTVSKELHIRYVIINFDACCGC